MPTQPAAHPALRTPICELFGIDWPIVQTGMGWVAGPRLVSATAAAGALGILASATMSFAELRAAIAEVKSRTEKPFGVNLRSDHAEVDRFVELLLAEKVAVASFAQAPNERLIKALRDGGVKTMPTIAARRHAEKVVAWGVDAVIAQGHEGGGHTGQVPTSLLLPQVADAVGVPVVGAGGFFDGRGVVAALAWGGAGVAMGTRFLLTKESTVPDAVKERYLAAGVTDTVVTRAVDGHPQRVIRTSMVDRLERALPGVGLARASANAVRLRRLTSTPLIDLVREGLAMKKGGDLTWAETAMAANAPMLTKAALVDGKLDAGVLPTGQVAGLIEELPSVEELVQRIVADAGAVLDRLGRTPTRSETVN